MLAPAPADLRPAYHRLFPQAAAPEASPEPEPAAATEAAGEKWVAQYDYTAADTDEVSFADGDFVIDVEVIDDGWVKGTVEKSGERGMIPSNYVEKQA